MPNATDVRNLLKDLNDKKIVDSNASVEKMLSVNADHIVNRGQEAGWYVVGGEHFVVVCGLEVKKQILEQQGLPSRPGR
jgi:hypothetical protein